MEPEPSKSLLDIIFMILQQLTLNEFFMGTIAPLLTIYVVKWFRAKILKIENTEIRDALNDALTRLDLTADTVVKELNQTLRDKMVRDENGKLTPAQIQELKRIAYARVKSRIPNDAMEVLKKTFMDHVPEEAKLEGIILGKIQKKVVDAKECRT